MEQNQSNFDSIFKVRKPLQYKNEDQIDLIALNTLNNEDKQQIIKNAICDKKILSKSQFDNIFQLLKCPICLEIFNDPYYVKACSHRFCKTCIEDFVRKDKSKECPLCRSHIGIKRNLRQDAQVQELCAIIFGNVSDFNKQLNDLESSFIDQNWNDIRVKESETVQKQKRSYNKLQKTVSDTIMTNQDLELRLNKNQSDITQVQSIINSEIDLEQNELIEDFIQDNEVIGKKKQRKRPEQYLELDSQSHKLKQRKKFEDNSYSNDSYINQNNDNYQNNLKNKEKYSLNKQQSIDQKILEIDEFNKSLNSDTNYSAESSVQVQTKRKYTKKGKKNLAKGKQSLAKVQINNENNQDQEEDDDDDDGDLIDHDEFIRNRQKQAEDSKIQEENIQKKEYIQNFKQNIIQKIKEDQQLLKTAPLLYTVKLIKLPSDLLTPQIKFNIIQTISLAKTSNIQEFICQKINLEKHYSQYIQIFIMENQIFKEIKCNLTLKDINDQHWKIKDDLLEQNIYSFYEQLHKLEQYKNNVSNIHKNPQKVLYYKFDFDKL